MNCLCSWPEARVRNWNSPCEVCGGVQSGTGTGICPVIRFFPVFVIPLLYLICSRAVVRTNGRSLRIFKRSNGLSDVGEAMDRKYLHVVCVAFVEAT
jgi:hypothetical protein